MPYNSQTDVVRLLAERYHTNVKLGGFWSQLQASCVSSHAEQLFGLVSLFNGISTFVGYLMPKPSF